MSSATLTRHTTRPAAPEARGSVVLAGIAAAAWVIALAWAAIVALAIVGWATAGSTVSAASAARLGSQLWLLVHHVALEIRSGGRVAGAVTLPPLGLTLGVLALMYRGGIVAARSSGARTVADCSRTAAAFAAPYATICVVVAGASRMPTVQASTWQAALFPGLLAFAVSWIAAVRHVGVRQQVIARIPVPARLVARAVGRLGIAWFVASAVLLAVAATLSIDRVNSVVTSMNAGAVGTALLALATVLFVPNGVAWAGSYLLGGGISAGDAAVSPFAVTGGQLPSLPPLAVLPQSAPTAAMQLLVATLPLLALVVAWRLERAANEADEPWWHPYARGAAFAAGVTVLLTAIAAVSGGGVATLGFGPLALRDAGLTFAATLVAATVVATVRTWRRFDPHVAAALEAVAANVEAVQLGIRSRLTGR
ncbi:MAG: hypothetical protein JWM93_2279 [Frankiales bacterium]|nr:hypothetical protein [Frankiales bacterium]